MKTVVRISRHLPPAIVEEISTDQFHLVPADNLFGENRYELVIVAALSEIPTEKTPLANWIFIFPEPDFVLTREVYEKNCGGLLSHHECHAHLNPLLIRLANEVNKSAALGASAARRNFSQQQAQLVKQAFLAKSQVDDAREIVRRLRNNLSQGAGFGAILTIAEVFEVTAQPADDGFFISKDIFDGFMSSAGKAKETFNAMNFFIKIAESAPDLEPVKVSQILQTWEKSLQKISSTAELNNRIIVYSREDVTQEKTIRANLAMLDLVFKEIIVNALKFSRAGESVIVLPVFREFEFGFMTLNTAHESHGGITGVPRDYETKVFEPFFRIGENSDDSFSELEITHSLGLGLTLAHRLVRMHAGEISIGNIENHSVENSRTQTRVITEVLLPYSA